ncbi:MAG: HD domain-containing protein [Bacilli bacterium]|nr:HD domain-containing protein [Bacilli bacterium]
MDFYSSLILITVLLMVAMTLHVVFYHGFTRVQKTWYLLTFGSITFCSLAEFAVHCGYYDPAFAVPLTILTVLQFSTAPLLGVFFSGALGMHRESRFAAIPFLIHLIIEIVAAPFGWIFSFTESGYSRGDYFLIYEIFYFISLGYLVVSMFIVGRRFRNRDIWTIGMVLVLLVAGIIPMTIWKINVTYVSIGIAAAVCYIYYNDLVQQDTMSEFAASQQRVSQMQEHIITGLSSLIEGRDLETGEHVQRTKAYVTLLAQCAREDGVYSDVLDDQYISLLQTFAPLHDIGKILVSDRILKKPGKLTPEEFEEMKKHASQGGDVVREVLNGITDEEYLGFASDIATYHHERWDGAGYPNGLQGGEIPLSARIMAIADVFDALISRRCYKEPMSFEGAFSVMKAESGTHFDPKLIEVLLRHKDAFIASAKSPVDPYLPSN